VAARILQRKHLAGKLAGRPFDTIAHLADWIVLAVHAAEIAIGEENGAGTLRA
jgi:hypothetical protein